MTLLIPSGDRRPEPGRAIGTIDRGSIARPISVMPRGDAEDEPLDWRRIWSAIRQRRWLVLGIAVVGTLCGVLAAQLVRPRFRAQATIWIDARDRHEAGPAPFQPGRLLDPEAWLDLVRSYAVLDAVARDEHLFLEVPSHTPPEFVAGFQVADSFRPGAYRLQLDADGRTLRLTTADGIELDRGAPGDSLGRRLGFRWTPGSGAVGDRRSVAFDVIPLRDASAHLADDLQLHIDPEGNLLRLELEGTDRVALAATLDQVATRYVAVVGDLKRQKLTELSGILADQLASASRDLATAESTYQVFRARTITLPSERLAAGSTGTAPSTADGPATDPVLDRYFGLQDQRGALARDRQAIERALDAPGGTSVEALNSVPAARQSRELGPALDELAAKEGELRSLRARYSEAHPEVIQLSERVDALRQRTIPALARALAAELRTREGLARRDEAAAGTALRGIPARSLEDARLRRTVGLAEDLYNTLQQRHEEARLAVESSIPDARVLDHAAVPRFPIRDTAIRLIALACVASLGLAFLVAVLLDRFDPRFRYPSQVLRDLGLPIIGAIPHVPPSPRVGAGRSLRSAAPLIEALRGIRMSLMNTAGGITPFTLALSSPGSGDGKSFLSSHLAFTFAEAGFRTLLIDGDIRCGRLHKQFAMDRRPGLCDLLQGSAEVSDVLRETGFPGLTLLPCGARAQSGPELLGGPVMATVMSELRDRFDVILCDTPPLSAGVDPYLLAVTMGQLALVLRTGISHREMMAAKLAIIGRMPIDLLGVVMNDVPPDPAYGYYSYHLEGYEAREEIEGTVTAGA